MSEGILDASALLALLYGERGSEVVEQYLAQGLISTVNLAEVVTKLSDDGMPNSSIRALLGQYQITVAPFDEGQAFATGFLRPETRFLGLSLGDRACLGLAIVRDLPVLTADRAWAELDLGIEVRLVR